jgi:glutathione S-transferase
MRLLGRPSSINVRKVLWTLAEVGVEASHEDHWGTPASTLRAPEFLKLNPNGLVPVLVDDDTVLWESNTICRYLAGKAGRSDLLPVECAARAQVEMWMDWQATELNPTWGPAFKGLVRDRRNADPAAIERSTEAWNGAMALLDAQLRKTGAYAAGKAFTLADIVIGLSAHRWRQTPLHHAALPCVEDYLLRLEKRAGFKRFATPDMP